MRSHGPASDSVESDYYAFMRFDRQNAEDVLRYYVPFFLDGPVLELACGPGVFLDLLRDHGIECRGVDIDDGMVAECRARGHDVALFDATAYLHSVPSASLRGLFAAHFIEHLTVEQAQEVCVQAARVLAPGGVFVVVVPNPACLSVLTIDFWRDPTHVRFYDPVLIQFLARQAGLSVSESSDNPRNHPGPPPGLLANDSAARSDVRSSVGELVRHTQHRLNSIGKGRRRDVSPVGEVMADVVGQLGHLLSVLNHEVLTLSHEVESLRASNHALIERLYPANEVFVVARKDADR